MIVIPDGIREQECMREGYSCVVGIDEAGRGPLCGPVYACAAALRVGEEIPADHARLIRDSKTLTPKQREQAYDIVREYFFVGVGEASAETIDRMNILQATFLAMKKAIASLKPLLSEQQKQEPMLILTDGDKEIPHLSLTQRSIIGGDRTVRSIAAASIVAKVLRDRLMVELHAQYPLYGFDRNKGYGTRDHMEALKKYGPTPIHRCSFRPVREAIDLSGINRQITSFVSSSHL